MVRVSENNHEIF